MSKWYETIPYGPLKERDFIKLGSVLQLSDSYDPISEAAVKVAEQRLAYPSGALRHSIQRVVAEFSAGSEELSTGETYE